MVKHKRGFIFNLHVGSIIRHLWSAGFEWESGLFATASQPVWHLVAWSQLRQELSVSCSLCLSVSISVVCTLCGKHGWYQVRSAHALTNRSTPLLFRGVFFCFSVSSPMWLSFHHEWGSNWAKPFWYAVTQKFFLKALLKLFLALYESTWTGLRQLWISSLFSLSPPSLSLQRTPTEYF